MEQMKQQNKKPVVVGIGELLWDLLPTGKTAGGAPINFVYHASRLGAEGYAISAIGDDDNGRDILSELDKYKIQYLIEKLPYPTGTVHVDIEDDGIPHYTITERVAWDHMSPTSDAVDLAERADSVVNNPVKRFRLFFRLLPIRRTGCLILTCGNIIIIRY